MDCTPVDERIGHDCAAEGLCDPNLALVDVLRRDFGEQAVAEALVRMEEIQARIAIGDPSALAIFTEIDDRRFPKDVGECVQLRTPTPECPPEEILRQTRRGVRMSLTLEQLATRKGYIGASEAAAACGLSPWKTPYELWSDKTSAIVIEAQSSRMEWGHRLEGVVMLKYLEDLPPEAGTLEAPCQFQVSADYPWMGCTPDGLLPDRVVEIKTAGLGQAREWGEEGTDAVPLQYLLQVTHQMICTGRKKADIPVLIGGNDYRVYSVDLDEELANLLITRERDFWQHVENKTPPEVKSIADAQSRAGRRTAVSPWWPRRRSPRPWSSWQRSRRSRRRSRRTPTRSRSPSAPAWPTPPR